MDLTLTHCFITVRDLDEALTFYRDTLGLEVRTDVHIGDFRWLTIATKGSPVEISLETPDGRSGNVETIAGVIANGGIPAVILGTTNCDATFATLQASGSRIIQEPTDQPYGVRDCAVRDPSGNMVRIAQPLT